MFIKYIFVFLSIAIYKKKKNDSLSLNVVYARKNLLVLNNPAAKNLGLIQVDSSQSFKHFWTCLTKVCLVYDSIIVSI